MRTGWVGNYTLAWDYGEPTRELIVQIIPIIFFYPLKATCDSLLAVLSLPINIMPFWSKGRLGDPDLLELKGGCAVDAALARGLCVERDGFFQLWFLAFTFSKRWFQVWRDARLEGGR
ncbi:hypothetical protein FIBSPDRAFT_873613 [Athelia psychrophila]|uniref:Uncharacterized protein n=1 Tax=Athelia psychrophila TaxID=1759441 RepID=A0A165YB78_9AGAM|nr:hypothetical protein FIBSPDRAFT_873613 [Fibularhizoctonia sp. CBS 109695]